MRTFTRSLWLITLFMVSAQAAAPPIVAQRDVPARRVELQGAANFRDLGGYPTSNGRHVKWGLVFRSNHLANLTVADYRMLDTLHIRTVFDLRTAGERQRSPTVWVGANKPEFVELSILKESDVVVSPGRLKALASPKGASELATTYDRMILESAADYGNILRRQSNGSLPSVTHCTAGKDRTGVFDTIERQFGSFERFVRDGLRLTPFEVEQLRLRLLE